MKNIINNDKIKVKTKDFAVFCFFLFTWSRGCYIFNYMDPRVNIIGVFLYFICFFYLISKTRIKWSMYSIAMLILLFTWMVIHFLNDSSFQIIAYGTVLTNFIVGYLLVHRYGFSLIRYYEKAVFLLASISLVFFILQTVVGYEMIAKIPHFEPTFKDNESASFIVCVVHDNIEVLGRLPRNSGFAWEPGMYSVLLTFSIMFRIILQKGNISLRDKHLFVYVIALLTTFSTTGYMSVLSFIGLHLLSKSNMSILKKGVLIGGFSVLVLWLLTLPFMAEKIQERANPENFVMFNGLQYRESIGQSVCVDRFEGIVLDLMNLEDKPIWGYGLSRDDSYVSKVISSYLVTSNGLVGYLAQFGLLFGLSLYLCMFVSSIKLARLYDYPAIFALFIVSLVTSVSYNFFDNSIMCAFACLCLFKFQKNEPT